MPKIELKTIQTELEQGLAWPLYCIFGPEKLKSRELVKRIRQTLSGPETGKEAGNVAGKIKSPAWGETVFEGSESETSQILDSLLSPSLFGGIKLVIIKDAHALKNPELLTPIMGSRRAVKTLEAVCICLAKDLDGRKKFSKVLLEKAAVIPCEEVPEGQKASWIQFLAKRKAVNLDPSWLARLCSLESWSLDLMEQELEKIALSNSSSEVPEQNCHHSLGVSGGQAFLESFFSRNLQAALPWVSRFADNQDEALPLLGLLGWNVKQLSFLIADKENGTRYAKMNPYMAEQFRKWSTHWNLQEILKLQEDLSRLDFSMKQRPLMPLGLWSHLVIQHCTL